jgi:hypothetical protein
MLGGKRELVFGIISLSIRLCTISFRIFEFYKEDFNLKLQANSFFWLRLRRTLNAAVKNQGKEVTI